jgi:uncharacterized protein involved in response to NO
VLAILLADALQLHGGWLAALCLVAALAHLARLALWQPWKTLRTPIVWILHAAYLWIPVHLALRACAELGQVPTSAAIHALTVGAIGALVLGMMTRTARGHTGRPLAAGRAEVACYSLVLLAAIVRVFVPLAAPEHTVAAIVCSAALWSAAFGVYAVRYWPVLTRPRLDGKPG